MHSLHGDRDAAIAAIGGALLLFAGTYLHPMRADPNVPLAAFTEYAADHNWVASHLMQLCGVALMVAALVLLSRRMAGGPAAAAALGTVGAMPSLAIAAALQAVDGIALKAILNTWATAPEGEREALFHAAFAVRQIEIGLASVTSVLLGSTVSIYSFALLTDPRFPKWLGLLAFAGGVPTAIAGIVIAYTGLSALAMAITVPSSSLLLCWMVAVVVYVCRSA